MEPVYRKIRINTWESIINSVYNTILEPVERDTVVLVDTLWDQIASIRIPISGYINEHIKERVIND